MSFEIDTSLKSSKPFRTNKGKSLIAFPDDFILLDIETTGLDTSFDSIIEVAAIRVQQSKISDSFTSLINQPDINLNEYPEIVELTGITQAMLDCAPCEREVISNLYHFVGNSIVIGHNVNFDINFLYDSLCAYGISFNNNYIDTLRLSRRLLPELQHHRLSDLANFFNIEANGTHRALKDCEITLQCYEHLKQLALEKYDTLEAFAGIWQKSKLHAVDITATNEEFDETHPLYKKVCVFTGTLEKMQRKDAMQIVVNLGGICADSVTKKTNYVILGNNDYCSALKGGKSNKQKRAEELKAKGCDITIISENTFYDMIEDN